MKLKDYTTEELKAELKRRDDLAEVEETKKKEYTLKFAEYIENRAKEYDFNIPPRSYDIYNFAKDLLAWIKPKFKVGDWIVNKLGDLWYIDSLDKKSYQVSDEKGNCNYFPISKQDEMHFWTIQDAKDGDVLASYECLVLFKKLDRIGIKCYCTYNFMNHPKVYLGTFHNKNSFNPATKEQRDLLFTMMKETGYKWDFNKKELIKIEDKPKNYK